MIESLNERFWHAVMFFVVAVASAALLRHAVHVYCGVSPEQIRICAVVACFFVSLLFSFSLYRRS
jgi:hypothetical protein